jgi:CRP-like cAMP-binding protein
MYRRVDALLVALSKSVALREVPEAALCASLPLWSAVDLRPGMMLWRQGRPADALGLVQSGELEVVVDGTVIGRVGAGEMIGVGAIFQREATRIASLRADQRTRVLVLWSAGLRLLRGEQGPLYAAILRHALRVTVRRGRALERRLVQVREDNFVAPEEMPESSGLLARLWTLLRAGPDPSDCPPLGPLLARRPPLSQVTESERAALLRAFTGQPFRAGDLLVREGEVDGRMLVLTAGAADVVRAHPRHEWLGHLEPGAIVGVDGFAGEAATTSIVATGDGWAHAIDRSACEQLPLAQELALAAALDRCHAAAHALQAAIAMFAARHEEPLVTPDSSLAAR